jgi:hypothetical protein
MLIALYNDGNHVDQPGPKASESPSLNTPYFLAHKEVSLALLLSSARPSQLHLDLVKKEAS